MVEAIETRELITVNVGGSCLRGTCHLTPDHRSGSAIGQNEGKRTGVLFVNSGYAPRSGSGDAAVYWADSFAKSGYPSFRLDLPGLGDSDGDLPEKWLELSDLINGGHYSSFVSDAAKSLTESFHLSGVVIVGHCAGAISAIYAATSSKHIKGIVALDPYFFQNDEERTAIRQEMSHWVARHKLAAQFGRIFGRLKQAKMLLQKNKLPGNTNLRLIRCWKRLASAGLPMLVLNARSASQDQDFDYFQYLQESSGSGSRIVVQFIEGANHSFADDVGRPAVQRLAERWLKSCFPLVIQDEHAFSGQLTANHQR
ncbi:MAG: alpha/beta fold hydrolase [Bryobacteraceae bacterium]